MLSQAIRHYRCLCDIWFLEMHIARAVGVQFVRSGLLSVIVYVCVFVWSFIFHALNYLFGYQKNIIKV